MPENRFYRLSLGITNCFLINAGDFFILVDTSTQNKFRHFLRKLEKLNIHPAQIKYLFITHHHTDHCGFIEKFLELSKATLIIHKKALASLLSGTNNPEMKAVSRLVRLLMILRKLLGIEKRNPGFVPGDNTVYIEEDVPNLFASQGFKAKIICTNGHTSDSICIITENGDAFVGDAAMNLPFLTKKYYPMVAEQKNQIPGSWKKIVENGGTNIHVSHGKSIHSGQLLSVITGDPES